MWVESHENWSCFLKINPKDLSYPFTAARQQNRVNIYFPAIPLFRRIAKKYLGDQKVTLCEELTLPCLNS